jgi:hypothetical protein
MYLDQVLIRLWGSLRAEEVPPMAKIRTLRASFTTSREDTDQFSPADSSGDFSPPHKPRLKKIYIKRRRPQLSLINRDEM